MPVWASVEHTLATECTLVRVSGAVTATFHSLRGGRVNNRNILSHNCGGWKSEIELMAGLVPSVASLLGLQVAVPALCASLCPHLFL